MSIEIPAGFHYVLCCCACGKPVVGGVIVTAQSAYGGVHCEKEESIAYVERIQVVSPCQCPQPLQLRRIDCGLDAVNTEICLN